MSRKDFQLIADAIATIQDETARKLAATALADALPASNTNFKRSRFLKACNVDD